MLLRECTELGEKQGLRFSYYQPLYRTSQWKGDSGKFQEQAHGLILHTALTLTINGMLTFEYLRILSIFFLMNYELTLKGRILR